MRATVLLSLAATFIGCLASREPTSDAAVPVPQVVFQASLANDAQLQEGSVELTDPASTLSLLMGRESGPARLCLLGELRVRNPAYDPTQDDPQDAWEDMDGPLLYETEVTIIGQSVSSTIEVDGLSLFITGTLAQDWQALRLIVPPLGSMRMTRARSFPACEEDPGDDSADP